ncbi:hypothetical protein MN608_08720 [Microdochium nivale]|nr:hypothetical protein MN608_08720 [Microdochium nivale]
MSTSTRPQQPRSIAIVGAGGNIGKHILEALLAQGLHRITILTRAGSSASFDKPTINAVTAHPVDYTNIAALVSLLRGIDVLVVTVAPTAYPVQTPLFRAAAEAGVPYVLPCEFGGDPDAPLRQHLDFFSEKDTYRALVEELRVSSWIGVACGPWFEFVMGMGARRGVDLAGKTALLQGSETTSGGAGGGFGMEKASMTTFKRTGEMVAGLLGLPEDRLAEYKNRWVFVSSFTISQHELLESAVRVTGSSLGEWKVTHITTESLIAAVHDKKGKPETFMERPIMLMQLVFGAGLGGDFSQKTLSGDEFGLQQEDLDEAVRRFIA